MRSGFQVRRICSPRCQEGTSSTTANLTICGNIKNFPVEALALLVLCQGPSHSVTMYVTATVARGCILDRAWHRNLVRRIRLHPPAQIEGDEAGV